jgi:hypothetical protein
MSEKRNHRATRHTESMRKRRQRQLATVAICAGGAIVLAALALSLLLKPSSDRQSPAESAVDTPPPLQIEAPVTEAPVLTPEPTAAPTPAPTPTPEPEPTPTVVPGSRPDVISFYHPKDKNYSPRVRFGDTYTGPWKKGKDIGSFEAIPSEADLLDGEFFGDIFGAAWTAFPDANSCKIGYTLRYTLDDGNEIRYTMLSPKHIEHTEYIECWLYDDYHREPHKFYSHLKPSSMKSETLITSIKLTAGRQISHVTDLWLTAFICDSLDDFDAERNYIGNTSCTIHILKK